MTHQHKKVGRQQLKTTQPTPSSVWNGLEILLALWTLLLQPRTWMSSEPPLGLINSTISVSRMGRNSALHMPSCSPNRSENLYWTPSCPQVLQRLKCPRLNLPASSSLYKHGRNGVLTAPSATSDNPAMQSQS